MFSQICWAVFVLVCFADARYDDCTTGDHCPGPEGDEDESVLLQTKMSHEGAGAHANAGHANQAKESPSRENVHKLWSESHKAPKLPAAFPSVDVEEHVDNVAIASPIQDVHLPASLETPVVPLTLLSAESMIAASSTKQIGELYSSISSEINSDTNMIRDAGAQTPAIIHDIRLKGGLKGPFHYPHLHVVQGKFPSAPAPKDETVAQIKAFAPSSSVFVDDRVVLSLLCFLLISASALRTARRSKGDKGVTPLSDGHDIPNDELLSTWDGTVTTFSAVFGVGFLSLPYAMSLAGWIGAPLIMFFTGCTAYTGHLLIWALRQEAQKVEDARGPYGKPVVLGWGFLLGAAFGPRAERAVNIFLVIELWGYVLSGIVAASMNFSHLLDDLNPSAAIGITVLVQFLLTTVPMKTLSRLNVISNMLFVVCCLMFIVTGLLLPAKPATPELKFVKPEGLVAACGIIVFSPAAHSLYPAIMQRMKHPEQYPVCLKRAYALACIVYICFAIPGYYLFGSAVQPSAVMNIGADRNLIPLPDLGWMNYVAAFCMLVKVSILQPLIMTPLTSTIEGMLEGWAPRHVLSFLIGPSVLTISAVVAMHFADKIGALLNLVGSIFCMSIAFVLPAICYWRINTQSVGLLQKVAFSGLILLGGSFAILGLITALDT